MIALSPAERILLSLGIDSPGQIDLDAIAWTRGAIVNYRPLDRCEATIVGSKKSAVITVIIGARCSSAAAETSATSKTVRSTPSVKRMRSRRTSFFRTICWALGCAA